MHIGHVLRSVIPPAARTTRVVEHVLPITFAVPSALQCQPTPTIVGPAAASVPAQHMASPRAAARSAGSGAMPGSVRVAARASVQRPIPTTVAPPVGFVRVPLTAMPRAPTLHAASVAMRGTRSAVVNAWISLRTRTTVAPAVGSAPLPMGGPGAYPASALARSEPRFAAAAIWAADRLAARHCVLDLGLTSSPSSKPQPGVATYVG